jgi:hypothetical protein
MTPAASEDDGGKDNDANSPEIDDIAQRVTPVAQRVMV